jgi:hypothetical protein
MTANFWPALLLLTAIPVGLAETPPAVAAPVRVRVELSDGSVLVGIPAATSVLVRTSYARLEIGLAEIRAMQIADDHERAVVQFANGDRISGVLDGLPLKLTTVAGDVTVEMQHVSRVAIRGGHGGMGLVAHYTFDEDGEGTVRDLSGNGNEGRLVGAVAYEDARKGKVVGFSRRDAYVVADSPRLNMNGWKEASIAVWIQIRRHTTYGHVINRGPITGTTSGTFEMGVGSVYGKGVIGMRTSPGDERVITVQPSTPNAPPGWNQNLQPGRWYHLALTYDSTEVRYYIDGVQQVALPVPVPGTPLWDGPDTKLVIGTISREPFFSWADMYFDGLVDDVRVYDRCLTSEEVRELAAKGT